MNRSRVLFLGRDWKHLRLLLGFSPRLTSFGNFVDGRYTRTSARFGGGDHERSKEHADFPFVEAQIVVQKVEQLFLHEVNLSNIKHYSVIRPVKVLRRRIIQVFGGDNEGGEKNPMACARHTYSPTVNYALKTRERNVQPFAIVGNLVLSLSR